MTPTEHDIMRFEEAHLRNDRSKEAAIVITFGHSWVRHQQIVARLSTDRDAVAAYPMACGRARRVGRSNGLRQAGWV